MPIIRKAFEAGMKLSRMDKRAWDALYFGVRSDIKQGIKHGFGAGSLVGTFIEDYYDKTGNAPVFVKTPYHGNQKGYRYKRRFGSQYRKYKPYCKCHNRKRLGGRKRRPSTSRRYY